MSRKRVLLGFSIIAGGVCASLPFLRETPLTVPAAESVPVTAPQPIVHIVLPPASANDPASPALAAEPTPAESATAPSPYIDDGSQRLERDIQVATAASTPEEITATPKEKVAALPLLPVSFQVKQPDELHAEPWQPAKLAEGPAGPPREYKIRRTDTLEELALRFLGSQDRAEELFEANRSVLKDRHILPLGAVIRIPAGGVDSPSEEPESDLQPVGQSDD